MLNDELLYRLIGQKVKRLRDSLEPAMTQGQLAEVLGLQRTSITNIEAGQQKMTLDTLYRLCERFQVEASAVLPQLSDLKSMRDSRVDVGGHAEELGSKTASVLRRLRSES